MQDIFKSPDQARKYVLSWGDKFIGKKISYCDTSSGRRINFYDMTDDEAIEVGIMLKDMELEASERR